MIYDINLLGLHFLYAYNFCWFKIMNKSLGRVTHVTYSAELLKEEDFTDKMGVQNCQGNSVEVRQFYGNQTQGKKSCILSRATSHGAP